MKFTIVLLVAVCLVALSAVRAEVEEDLLEEYDAYLQKFDKQYTSRAEYYKRFQLYRESKERVKAHNADHTQTYKVGINQFSDMAAGERHHGSAKNAAAACFGVSESNYDITTLPASVDWRKSGSVPPVMNEGECGSVSYVCTAQQVSSAVAIATKKPAVPLSVQQMIDCEKTQDGCNGGDPWPLYTYVINKGLESAAAYPYKAGKAICLYDESKVIATITGSVNITGEKDLMVAVANQGPTIVMFDAGSTGFESYTSGIYAGESDCTKNGIDDVLLVVGYGTANKTDYWIAQNVWGTNWGMDGYVLVKRGVNVCGIATCSSYVTGAKAL